MTLRRRVRNGEQGATLIITVLCITVLFLIVAIVMDLGATRSDRRSGQLAVDNATSSAAQTFAETDAVTACADALDLLALTLETPPFSATGCSTFTICFNNTPNTLVATSGPYTVTIHHPVFDNSPLMLNTSTISNAGVTAESAEGSPCERFAVELNTTADPFFGEIAGSTERTSTVHAVALVTSATLEQRPLNLLTLERYDCQTFVVSGQGIVVVDAALDPNTGEYIPGTAAADSNASSACSGNRAVMETGGQGDIRADGPCPLNPTTVCLGEGVVSFFATIPGNKTCAGTQDQPACREGSTSYGITPDATQATGQFTRAPLDHRYNCKSSYGSEVWAGSPLNQPIVGCDIATPNTDYVDELKAFVASALTSTPAGWTVIGGSNPNCKLNDQTYTGNVIVDCNTYQPGGVTTFRDGNVIFRSKVQISGGAQLLINSGTTANTMTWTTGANYLESQSSPDAAWAYVGDKFTMSSGTVDIDRTMVLIGPAGNFEMTGGVVAWEGPLSGPFEDLALWSAGTATHSLNGGVIDLIGVFFNGQSTFKYVGTGNQVLDQAQFIANKLDFSGQGTIHMSPAPDRAVEFPLDPLYGLIR